MKLTPTIEHALFTAAHLHKDHKRVGLDVPYIVHPYSVALILAEHTKDEDIISAGLLHDTVEDVPEYTFEIMERDFNKRITEIIMHISEVKVDKWGKPISWQKRKKHYLESIENAPKESLMVCAADTANNLDSLLLTYKLCGDVIWKKFGSGIDNKMRFYGNVIEILERRLKGALSDRVRKSYIELLKVLRKEKVV